MTKIKFLASGGTFASVGDSRNGRTPKQLTANDIIGYVPELPTIADFTYENIYTLDSTNILPSDWLGMAGHIKKALSDPAFDAIVLTHGTDTMAYTAAALSYLLPQCSKKVIITGAQLPLDIPGTDAIANLKNAFHAAAASDLPSGIYIVFDSKIILGTHACKVKAQAFDAFSSLNLPEIGVLAPNGTAVLRDDYRDFWQKAKANRHDANKAAKIWQRIQNPLNIKLSDVMVIKPAPGYKASWLLHLSKLDDIEGFIIEGFGCGGITNGDRDHNQKDSSVDLTAVINKMVQDGKIVVIAKLTLEEKTDLESYAVGQLAAKAGALSAGYMITEALYTKLLFALSLTYQERRDLTVEKYQKLIKDMLNEDLSLETIAM